ncbi:MAG: hypothetical protein ACRC8S_11775 [Fimbriiglobus sp.]
MPIDPEWVLRCRLDLFPIDIHDPHQTPTLEDLLHHFAHDLAIHIMLITARQQ